MPRLVLYDDEGRILMDSQISNSAVAVVGQFAKRNAGALQAAAACARAWRAFVGGLGPPELPPTTRARVGTSRSPGRSSRRRR